MSTSFGNNRREFIGATSLLTLGMGVWSETLGAQAPVRPKLHDGLTLEELELVKRSRLADELRACFGKGNSCAESGLLASLRYLDKPEELVWIAGGFGDGLAHGDLCGFLTSGAMAIGLVAGTVPIEKAEAKKLCQQMMRQYWQDWASMAPLHCAEIRKGRTGFKVCQRLGLLACCHLERLMEPVRSRLDRAT